MPPIANAGPDQVKPLETIADESGATTTSVTVNFDGSGSSDPDGGTLNYAWNFGDGSTGSGEMLEHSYTSPDIYDVTLTVTDNDGLMSKDMMKVTVIDLNIKTPVENDEIVLTQGASSSTVNIGVYGEVLPASIRPDASIHWKITIGGEIHEVQAQPGQAGASIEISQFPTNINHFGPNTVTATVTYNGVSFSKDQPVKLFFYGERTENGTTEHGENLPNLVLLLETDFQRRSAIWNSSLHSFVS